MVRKDVIQQMSLKVVSLKQVMFSALSLAFANGALLQASFLGILVAASTESALASRAVAEISEEHLGSHSDRWSERKGVAVVERVFVDRSLDPSGSRAVDRELLRSKLSDRVQRAYEERLETSSHFDRELKPVAKPKARSAKKMKKKDRQYSLARGFAPKTVSTRQLSIKRADERDLLDLDRDSVRAEDGARPSKVIVLDSLE